MAVSGLSRLLKLPGPSSSGCGGFVCPMPRTSTKPVARQFLERAELHSFFFLSGFVDVEERRGIAPQLLRHKNPSGNVNTWLGDEIHFLNPVVLAGRRDQAPDIQRTSISVNMQQLRDLGSYRAAE